MRDVAEKYKGGAREGESSGFLESGIGKLWAPANWGTSLVFLQAPLSLCQPDWDWVVRKDEKRRRGKFDKRRAEESREGGEAKLTFVVHALLTVCQALC